MHTCEYTAKKLQVEVKQTLQNSSQVNKTGRVGATGHTCNLPVCVEHISFGHWCDRQEYLPECLRDDKSLFIRRSSFSTLLQQPIKKFTSYSCVAV